MPFISLDPLFRRQRLISSPRDSQAARRPSHVIPVGGVGGFQVW